MLIFMTTKKRLAMYFSFFMVGICAATAIRTLNRRSLAAMADTKTAYIAIIIDDFGNASKGTEEMLSLPIKFTGAVMPSMPKSSEEAELLHKAGKDVILHQPMEAHTGKRSWLGESPILNSCSRTEAKEILEENLSQIPYCIGVNNHMGSKVTENKELIEEIFNQLKAKNLFYVDSMTTGKSVTGEVAQNLDLDLIKRDVFLDSTQDLATVEKNVLKTGDIALKKGYAVAIGHVGAEGGIVTYKAINNTYKELEQKGIKFVGIGELNEIIKKSAD